MPASATQNPPAKQVRPDTGPAAVTLPPPRGSFEELAEAAIAVGFAGAFSASANRVKQLIRSELKWEE